MILYLDTSAFVKIYIDEPYAEAMRLAAENANLLVTSMVAYAEMRSAFARRRRSGDLAIVDLNRIKAKFEQDWRDIEAQPISDELTRRAGELAEALALKGFDAIHLASAQFLQRSLGSITFACFDAELARAAAASGMTLLPSS